MSRRRGDLLSALLPVFFVLVGVSVLMYPAIANWLADYNHVEAIQAYGHTAEEASEEQKQEWLAAARQYNESLVGDPVHDPFVPGSGYSVPSNYDDILNPDGAGVMGKVEIPKIDVNLPIYHGTDAEALEKGVGHIPVTPLPIGGEGWHSVLTGHRGLPSAELFTRLDELGEGDLVFVTILGETHAYRVCATEVVLPDELDSLASVAGRDLLTLVTCTPYGINTHRLLVHCERTDYAPEEAQGQAGSANWLNVDMLARIGGAAAGLAVLVALLVGVRRGSRKSRIATASVALPRVHAGRAGAGRGARGAHMAAGKLKRGGRRGR